MIYCNILRDY